MIGINIISMVVDLIDPIRLWWKKRKADKFIAAYKL